MKLAPGAWKISVTRDGHYLLRGTRLSGEPVRLPCSTRGEAERLAEQLFKPAPVLPVVEATSPDLDDWGLPKVTPQTVASVAAAVGARPATEAPPPGPTAEELAAEKKRQEDAAAAAKVQEKRRKYAATFSELLGSGWAMGVGMAARKTRDPELYDVARPSPKHLSDLADVTAEGIQQTFGDREIGPWTMCFMLSIGIVASVWFQSTKKKGAIGAAQPDLRSVP